MELTHSDGTTSVININNNSFDNETFKNIYENIITNGDFKKKEKTVISNDILYDDLDLDVDLD